MSPFQVVQGQLDAYNAHDVDAFAAFYDEQIELYRPPVGEPFLRGRDALIAHYRVRFANSMLHAGLVGRTSIGSFVFDHEYVTGVGESAIEAVATFQVSDGKIVRVWFFDSR